LRRWRPSCIRQGIGPLPPVTQPTARQPGQVT
jgi:hypothetical protein